MGVPVLGFNFLAHQPGHHATGTGAWSGMHACMQVMARFAGLVALFW